MLSPVTAILAMQIAAAGVPVGVAAAAPDGQICVAMPAPALTSGATLTLIQPDARQSVLVAAIVRPAPACERLERALISGPYYLVQPVTATASESGGLWLAFSGSVITRRLGSGELVVQLSAAYPNAQVRSCTSNEGLHLTVWAGTPLTSQRLWHQYYYLGYDVEPSCDERDYARSRRQAGVAKILAGK
jgi:hypothetical protein